MSFLTEIQDIIDEYPAISKGELTTYLELNYSNIETDGGTKEYDFGKILYWFSLRNLAILIDDVLPNAKDFEEEEERIKHVVYALEEHFIKKA